MAAELLFLSPSLTYFVTADNEVISLIASEGNEADLITADEEEKLNTLTGCKCMTQSRDLFRLSAPKTPKCRSTLFRALKTKAMQRKARIQWSLGDALHTNKIINGIFIELKFVFY